MIAWLFVSALGCAPRQPTVLIVIDTLRADLAGHVAPWESESRRYAQARSAAPYTTASTATLLTGLWPEEHGVTLSPHDGRQPLLASTLLEAAPSAAASDHYVPIRWGWLDRADQVVYRHADLSAPCNGSPWAVDAAARWDGDGLLYLHLLGPHGPWESQEASDRYHAARPWQGGQVDPIVAAWHAAVYRECVGRTLGVVADVLDALPEDAVVVITSDHGELLGEGGLHGHGHWGVPLQFEVPLWVVGPGVEPGVNEEWAPPTMVADMVRAGLRGQSL